MDFIREGLRGHLYHDTQDVKLETHVYKSKKSCQFEDTCILVVRLSMDLCLRDGRHIVVFSLLLTEKLEPAIDAGLHQLRDAEGERPHEVVARGSVPVPDLDQQASVLVSVFKVANFNKKKLFT